MEKILFDGQYKVSSDGRVFHRRKDGWKEISPYNGKNAYRLVALRLPEGRKITSVHRLVAEAFIPNPYGKSEVNHLDGDKGNDRIENLEWATRSENVKHAYSTGLAKRVYKTCARCGKPSGYSDLCGDCLRHDADQREREKCSGLDFYRANPLQKTIVDEWFAGASVKELSARLGLSPQAVSANLSAAIFKARRDSKKPQLP